MAGVSGAATILEPCLYDSPKLYSVFPSQLAFGADEALPDTEDQSALRRALALLLSCRQSVEEMEVRHLWS